MLLAPAAGTAAEPVAPGDASLASIAASLERIESLLRLGQSSRLIELRLARLEVLRQEMAPLEARLRNYTEVDFWEGPEMALQRERLEQLREEIEKARLEGREEQIAQMEMQVREYELQVEAHKKRQRLKREQAELVKNQLSALRSEREAAVAEIDRWLARLESDMRREREP
ncbi:MAG: hypothetical protein ACREI7_02680 [Myxococcota bacterium]